MIKKTLLYIEASLCFMLTTRLSLSNTNTYTTIITYTMPIFSSHAQPIGNNIFTALLSLLLSMKILFFLGLASSLPTPSPSHFSKFSNADIFSACKRTPHKAACESMLSSTLQSALPETLEELFDHSVKFSMDRAYLARALANNLTLNYEKSRSNDITSGMNDCLELLDDTLDQLTNVVSNNNNNNNNQQTQTSTDDIQTWLSAAYTNQETCLESLKNDKVEKGLMDSTIQNLGQLIGNTLSLHVSSKTSSIRGGNRRLLYDDFPSWVSVSERKLLHASMGEIEVSAVVAKDGSGPHKTIGEALEASMEDGGRTVIHVRAGTYHEYLKIPTKQKNVMLVGDGKGKTVIVGDRSNAGGWTTFQSATVGKISLPLIG